MMGLLLLLIYIIVGPLLVDAAIKHAGYRWEVGRLQARRDDAATRGRKLCKEIEDEA